MADRPVKSRGTATSESIETVPYPGYQWLITPTFDWPEDPKRPIEAPFSWVYYESTEGGYAFRRTGWAESAEAARAVVEGMGS
jgi:hypothetical protein